MAFQKIETVMATPRNKRLVSFSISPKRGLTLGFSSEVAKELKLAGERHALLVGAGDDAGKIRISKDPGGVSGRKTVGGGYVVTFGRNAKLGYENGARKVYIDWNLTNDGLEFAVPDDLRSFDEEKLPKPPPQVPLRPTPTRPAGATAPRPTVPVANGVPQRAAVKGDVLEKDGILIDTRNGTITHGGETADLTETGAAVALAMLRTYPEMIGKDFLVGRTLHNRANASTILHDTITVLDGPLDGIGLTIKSLRGGDCFRLVKV